ncbi:hypothetical protein VTH82DRAFT_3064 [Thermothelomyces myriococcoides]
MAPESSMPSQNRPPSAERARHNPIFSTNPLHKNDNEDTGNENITSPGIPLLPAANKRLIRHPTSAPAMMGEHLPQAEPEPGQSGDRVTGFDNETAIERVQRRDVATSVERERLLGGIDLAWATLFSVSHNRKVTMLEGALARISPSSSHERRKGTSAPGIGENVYEVLNRLRLKPLKELLPPFFEPLESVLNGRTLVASQVSEIGVTGLIVDLSALDSRTAARLRSDCGDFTVQPAAGSEEHHQSSTSHGVQATAIGVASMARLLLSDKTLRGDQRMIATRLHGLARELLGMLNDRLSPSTAEPEKLNSGHVRFSVPRATRAVLNHLRPAAEAKGLAFRTHIEDKIASGCEVMGDPIQLQHVMVNLLSNSLQSTSRGYVKFTLEEDQERPNSTVLKIKVEDTSRFAEGSVMSSPSITPQLNCPEGGLDDCKTMVEAMQGRMTLDTSWGVGTTITVWVPFKKAPGERLMDSLQAPPSPFMPSLTSSDGHGTFAAERGQASRSSTADTEQAKRNPRTSDLPSSQRGGGILVLVAEDDIISQKLTITLVEQLGFRAAAASNGSDVLNYIRAAMMGQKLKPGVILMDLRMPFIDGFQCTDILRHRAPYSKFASDIPIVAVAASNAPKEEEELRCKCAGMDEFLPKPLNIDTLERVLTRWAICGRQVEEGEGD